MNAKDAPLLLTTALSLALAGGCNSTQDAPPLEFASCSDADSPEELLRVAANPEDVFVEAFDLGEAISVRFSGHRGEPRFSLLDHCGGSPIELRETFELPTGAVAVGGDVVLCGGGFGARSGPPVDSPNGVWQLLDDGSAREDLALGHSCTADVSTRLPSFGIVYADDDVVTQHLPDGTQRVISTGAGFELITTPRGAAVFSFGTPTTIHPADGSTSIEVEFPEAPRYVVQQTRSARHVGLAARHPPPAPRRTRSASTRRGLCGRGRHRGVVPNPGILAARPRSQRIQLSRGAARRVQRG